MTIYKDAYFNYWAADADGAFRQFHPNAQLATTAELISRAGEFPLRPYGVQNLPSGERVLNLREPTLTRPVVPLFPAGAAWGSKALRMAIPETHRVFDDTFAKEHKPVVLSWVRDCYRDVARGRPSPDPTLSMSRCSPAFVSVIGALLGPAVDVSPYFHGADDWTEDADNAGVLHAANPGWARVAAFLEGFVSVGGRWERRQRAARLVLSGALKQGLRVKARRPVVWDGDRIRVEAPAFAEWLLEQG